MTKELVDAIEGTKKFDQAYETSGRSKDLQNLKYVEREEDPELKAMYESEMTKFNNMSKDLHGQIDGELDMDLHGNITFRPPKDEEQDKTGL